MPANIVLGQDIVEMVDVDGPHHVTIKILTNGKKKWLNDCPPIKIRRNRVNKDILRFLSKK